MEQFNARKRRRSLPSINSSKNYPEKRRRQQTDFFNDIYKSYWLHDWKTPV